MSNPTGDYGFAGLGFTALRLLQEDGSKWIGYLYYGGEGSTVTISGATYTDATGVVTFGAGASPAGIRELNFTGNVILDMSANVTAIAGTWTGRAFINAPVAADLAAPAPAPAEPAIHKIGQIIPILAHGAWTAFNRQNIIQ